MPEFTVELAVGDVLIIGNRTLTVIDIEGTEVHFRIDQEPSAPQVSSNDLLANSPEQPAYRAKAK